MASVFLCGPLGDAGLRAAVLGADLPVMPAALEGFALVGDAPRPGLVASPGAGLMGSIVDLDAGQMARLRYWLGDLPAVPQAVTLSGAEGAVTALCHVKPVGQGAAPAWDAQTWAGRWRETVIAAVPDVMAQMGTRPAAEVFERWPQILTRAGARLRAADAGPVTLRHAARPGDVAVFHASQPYAHYFAVEEYDLCFRRFDGTQSQRLNRAVFISGDAVVVLPYDPLRDRVHLIEQFRAGPHGRGDPQPWLIEAVAGRIDGGETPEATARREAIEEAGLTLGALHRVADYYPSPAAKAEYIYSFVGICDLSDTCERLGGLVGEGEDILSHVVPFARLMDLVATGEVTNAPLLLCAYWLAAHRDRLRHAAGA